MLKVSTVFKPALHTFAFLLLPALAFASLLCVLLVVDFPQVL